MKSQENIFIDTGAWVALADRDDDCHRRAVSVYPSLLKSCRALVTSNLVVAESYVLVLHALGHTTAMGFLEKIHASPRILKIYSNEEIESDAKDILRKYTDQDFSYTDAVSFAIMRMQRIEKVFCFDKHFLTAGFVRIP